VLALLAANVSADSSPPSPDGQFSIQRQSVVEIGKDAELNTNEVADDVVVIGGSAKILGDVNQNVVVIGGDVELDSHVGGDVVVVMGDAHLGRKPRLVTTWFLLEDGPRRRPAPSFTDGRKKSAWASACRIFFGCNG